MSTSKENPPKKPKQSQPQNVKLEPSERARSPSNPPESSEPYKPKLKGRQTLTEEEILNASEDLQFMLERQNDVEQQLNGLHASIEAIQLTVESETVSLNSRIDGVQDILARMEETLTKLSVQKGTVSVALPIDKTEQTTPCTCNLSGS